MAPMRRENYRLELANGTVIDVCGSVQSGYPVVKPSDVPRSSMPAFSITNLPKGHGESHPREETGLLMADR